MAGGGPPSTFLLITAKKDVDADPSLRLGQTLRRHDELERRVVEEEFFGRLAQNFHVISLSRQSWINRSCRLL